MFEKSKTPILGILRGIEENSVEMLSDTCINAGLHYVEITMNTKSASNLIKLMNQAANGYLTVGAGTVLKLHDLEMAIFADAKFIVCPTIAEDVIKECVSLNIPVFPGALTPTEVIKAWDLGAEMVKLFPASVFGPSYIKELKAPLNFIKIMAVGGVNEQNINLYFDQGADAVAFGASIFKQQWITECSYDLIEKKIKDLIQTYRKHHNE